MQDNRIVRQPLGELFQRLGIAGDKRDSGAILCKRAGNRCADPAAGAGNDGVLAAKIVSQSWVLRQCFDATLLV